MAKTVWQKCGKSLHFLQRAEVIIVATNMAKKERQDVSNMKQLLKSIETASGMDNFRLNLKNKHSRKTLNVLTFLYGWSPGHVGSHTMSIENEWKYFITLLCADL